jgi:hypothetical protein
MESKLNLALLARQGGESSVLLANDYKSERQGESHLARRGHSTVLASI